MGDYKGKLTGKQIDELPEKVVQLDTEVGMYDLANGKFYGSYNSNVFIYSLE